MIEVLVDFDPFRVTMPPGDLTGEVRIVLPELRLKLIDLGMGDLDACIVSDARVLALAMDLGDNVITGGEFLEILEKTKDQWRAIHTAAQTVMDNKFLLEA